MEHKKNIEQSDKGKFEVYVTQSPKKTIAIMGVLILLAIAIHFYTGYIRDSTKKQQEKVTFQLNNQWDNIESGFPESHSPLSIFELKEIMQEYENLKNDSVLDSVRVKELENKLKRITNYEN